MPLRKIFVKPKLHESISLIFLAAVGFWVVFSSITLVVSDFKSMRARDQVDGWIARGDAWSASAWLAARAQLLDALKTTPDSPMLNDYMGAVYSIRGNQAWKDDRLRVLYFQAAEAYQLRSIKYREHNAPAWASLALSRYAIGLRDERLYSAVQQAIRLGQSELAVRRVVADVLLGTWSDAPVPLRQWLVQHFAKASYQEKQIIMSLAQRYGHVEVLAHD
jgi:hypothetical protein